MDLTTTLAPLVATGTQIAVRLIGALLLFFVGRIVIRVVLRAVDARLTAGKIDETLRRYAQNSGTVLLNILLILAVLSVCGVETTTFAGILAAAGLAIGMAWSGLLANFAAGAFLVVLRPFKVGDLIEAGGHLGAVEEVGLFVTTINTLDNVRTVIGNNTIFSGVIKNYSANEYRRVDLVAQLAHSVDPRDAITVLKQKLAQIDNVRTDPAPDVEILEFNLAGPVLAVRPYCSNDDYWQVYFDTNMLIKESFGDAGYPVPENHYRIMQQAG